MMGYRNFTDTAGVNWQAWDIVPRLAERRTTDRRVAPSPVAAERRRQLDRRAMIRERYLLSGGMQAGWLCFESAAEKRRLAPIPGDWLECAVPRLEDYLQSARPAPRLFTSRERAS
jgi:hypothetical protein